MPNEGLIPRLTPTSVSDLGCAKKFWTLRVLKRWPPRPPLSFSSFGTAFHAIIKEVYNPQNAPQPNTKHLETWAKKAFWAHRYADPVARDEDMARCVRMVKGYVTQDEPEDAEGTIAVERWGEFPYLFEGQPLFVLSAKLDRLIVRADEPDHLYVRDYKTTRPKTDLEEAFIGLWVARLLYPDFRHYSLQFDWIDEGGRVDRDTVEGATLKGMHAVLVRRALRILSSDDHPAEPGELCVFCPLRAECQPQMSINIGMDEDVFGDRGE